jgi:hypothetical protein
MPRTSIALFYMLLLTTCSGLRLQTPALPELRRLVLVGAVAVSLGMVQVSQAAEAESADAVSRLEKTVTTIKNLQLTAKTVVDLRQIDAQLSTSVRNDIKSAIKILDRAPVEYRNTVRYHGTTAAEDIDLIKEYGLTMPEDRALVFSSDALSAAASELVKFLEGIKEGDIIV